MDPTAVIVVFIKFPAPFPRILIPHWIALFGLNSTWFTRSMISRLLCVNSRTQLCICGIKSAILFIRLPIVAVSCGIRPNITSTITPTTSTIVRRRLIGLASFPATLLPFSFAFPNNFFSRKLIGTLITNAIAPPRAKGKIIPHTALITPRTTSNFHNATTISAVNTISSRIFFIDNLLKSTIFSILLQYIYG